MKKLLTLIFVLFAFVGFSQEDTLKKSSSDTVKLYFGNKEVVIITKQKRLENEISDLDSGIRYFQRKIEEQTALLNRFLDSLMTLNEAFLASNDSSLLDKMDTLRFNISLSQDQINALQKGIDDLKASMEELQEELEELNENPYNYWDTLKEDLSSVFVRKKKFKPNMPLLDISVISLSPDFRTPSEMSFFNQDYGKSIAVGLNFKMGKVKFWRSGGLVFGLGFLWRNIALQKGFTFYNDEGKLELTTYDFPFKKNKIKTSGLTLPVYFEVQFSKKKRFPYLQIGAVGEVVYSRYHKISYSDNGYDISRKEIINSLTNPFMAEASVRFGFRNIAFFANYSLLPLFLGNSEENSPVVSDIMPLRFGLSLF